MSDQPTQKEQTKKTADAFRDNASFLHNAQKEAGKPNSNRIDMPSITLPKGGGAVKGIDEKFSVNPSNGTAAYAVPLPLSKGRNNATPELSLTYNSGSGNSLFGLGWNVEIPGIQRKTEKELPSYMDALESDTFILSGAEDLVPVLVQNAEGKWIRKTATQGTTTIFYYRSRIEAGFSRIEQLNDGGNIYWRVRTKDNKVSVFGQSDDAKLFSPVATEGKDKIFKWCLQYTYDDKGNITLYTYKKENKENVSPALYEKNRLNDTAPFTNIYLKHIQYGNAVAWYEGSPLPTQFMFQVVFDFGEHDANKPTTAEVTPWQLRQDAFSNFRSGFEIRTYRLCRRILFFHHFTAELGWPDYLVRSVELKYDEHPHLTYLESITQTGYIWNNDGTLRSKRSLPPLECAYFKPGFSREIKEITTENIVNDPMGIDDRQYQWTDLYSEGISGILSEQAGGWFYKENLGNGAFSPAALVYPRPSVSGLSAGSLSIRDLEADGNKYLVANEGTLKGYFSLTEENKWEPFQAFEHFPNIDLKDPNLKFLDLNGDGMPDMLLSKEQEFVWYAAKGKMGYDDYHLATRAADEEQGPRIVFADQDEKLLIAIADMTGDGLADIVLITYAGVCFYPNLGYGRFGAKISIAMNGIFASFTDFNPRFVHLTDIDGSGTSDIVYTGTNTIQVWFNQSGNSLSDPFEFFNPFPNLNDHVKISFTDLLGTGTMCMVWSSPLPGDSRAPIRYIDMMGGRKPHVLYFYKNNRGRETTIDYRSSTFYYLADKQQGLPWITRLPFPVQCVSKVTVVDKVAQTRFANEYSYHHGYYDAKEREFRGFAMTEQRDSEEYDAFVKATQSAGALNTIEKDLYQPVVTTKTWFHTGAWLNTSSIVHQLQQEYYRDAQGLLNWPDQQDVFPDQLEPDAISECFRALKGLPLRKEIYSDEGDATVQAIPYTVTQYNYNIQILQPKAGQKYAVFFSHEKENIVCYYERNAQDPRIAHTINVEIDAYGNVLQSAAIVYGRKKADAGLPTDKDRSKQTAQYVVYTQNAFTTVIDTQLAYRLPVPCEVQTWELNIPANGFFTAAGIENNFINAATVLYEQETVANQKRKLSHSKTIFLRNDLTGAMPFGTQDTLALPYENYIMAFTPTLAPAIYGGKFNENTWRNNALYARFEGDTNYWIRSGRSYFHPDLSGDPYITSVPPATPADSTFAKSNFYQPVVFEDNTGSLTKLLYGPYKLFIQRLIDAVNNEVTVDGYHFRALSPYLLRDANDNCTALRFDELGLVTHQFVMGKQTEQKGDAFDINSTELSVNDQPGIIMEYDFRYVVSNGLLPDMIKTSTREQHFYTDPLPAQSSGGLWTWLTRLFGGGNSTPVSPAADKWQVTYSYTDGSKQEVLRKVQAEPGMAPLRDAQGKLVFDNAGNLQMADTTPELRWAGNGRTIFNNKGKPVKQYEPYFDSTWEYNDEAELTELGFTSILRYDAIGRVIRTDHANGSFSRTEFDAWMQKTYDENDTVLNSNWYQNRIGGGMGEAEQQAAQKAAVHSDTPTVSYLDSLGRVFMVAVTNKTGRSNETVQTTIYYTRTELDIQGHALSISDARNNTVMNWKYDMPGHICYQHSMDAGDRWLLADVTGKPIRLWDSRSQIFSYTYDALHRPLQLLVNTGASDTVYEQFEYGEGVVNDKQYNLRGRPFNHYDTAGQVTNEAYDFKGNALVITRTLLTDYKNAPDWLTNPALESEQFSNETAYDALNRPMQMITPDNSIFTLGYNEAGLLNTVDVQIQGVTTVTPFVLKIDYNAKGQREKISYGNNTITQYDYDLQTYRLTRLLTTGNNTILQDLNYTYDPVGNITRQFDNAQKTVFYAGQQVAAQNDYIYDAVYQLIEAGGREHIGQAGFSNQDNWNDAWSRLNLQPNSPLQLRNYSQKYFYDEAGNILKLQHIAGSAASFTRTYNYNAANNQLTRTATGAQTYTYSYNEHGSMLTMPQLTAMDWNFREELQHAGLGGGGDAWYVYSSSGQRVRKVIEGPGNKIQERIYLGTIEIYRERTGNSITLERQTLQVMDGKKRVAMIDTRTKGNDGTPAQLIRYQYGDHLGSASLELDDAAKIITYEEYHPFGTTAYQATDASRQVPAKRYRYTGMERDEETGFNYHTARYYIPWLGRFSAADPTGIDDGTNIYAYCKNNPMMKADRAGTDGVSVNCVPDGALTYCYAFSDQPISAATPSVRLYIFPSFLHPSGTEPAAPAQPAQTNAAAAQPAEAPDDGQPPTNVNTSATNSSGTNRLGSNEGEGTAQLVLGRNSSTGAVGSLGGLAAVRFSLHPPFTADTAPYVYAWDMGFTAGYSHSLTDTSSSGTFGLTARYGRSTNWDSGVRESHGVSLSLSAAPATDASGSASMALVPSATYIYERALSGKVTLDINALGTGTFGGGSTMFTGVGLQNAGTLGVQGSVGIDIGHRLTLGIEVLGYGTLGSGTPATPGGSEPLVGSVRAGGGVGLSRRFGPSQIPSATLGVNVDGFYEQTWSRLPGADWTTVQGGGVGINLGGTADLTRIFGH